MLNYYQVATKLGKQLDPQDAVHF